MLTSRELYIFVCNFFYNKENLDLLVIQNIDSYEQTASAINRTQSKHYLFDACLLHLCQQQR